RRTHSAFSSTRFPIPSNSLNAVPNIPSLIPQVYIIFPKIKTAEECKVLFDEPDTLQYNILLWQLLAGRIPDTPSRAAVLISGLSSKESGLKDLRLSGLRIRTAAFLGMLPNSHYTIGIIPEEEANVEKFALTIESRRIRVNPMYSESGFLIIVPPGPLAPSALL
ncbi:hypothetical protein ACYULU_14715, partial [Breznakiellaceae bacterium SP9]